jgi:hypothetical protein
MKRKEYSQPVITEVKLDNEISLQLSSPPPGPDEVRRYNGTPENNANDPYNND